MQTDFLSSTLLLQPASYFSIGALATALPEQVDCRVFTAQVLSVAPETSSQPQQGQGDKPKPCNITLQDVSPVVPPLLPVLTVAPGSADISGLTSEQQALSTPGSADRNNTARLDHVVVNAINHSSSRPSKHGEIRAVSSAGYVESPTNSPVGQSASQYPSSQAKSVGAPQQLLQRVHRAAAPAGEAEDQEALNTADHHSHGEKSSFASSPSPATFYNNNESGSRAQHKDASAAVPAASSQDQQHSGQQRSSGSLQHVTAELPVEQGPAAKAQQPLVITDVHHQGRPNGALSDKDALEAAAQLLLLQSAAEEYPTYSVETSAVAAAATGPADDQAVQVHCQQPHAADCPVVSFDRRPPVSRLDPTSQQHTRVANQGGDDAIQQQQQQQHESDIAVDHPVQERRSKRARKTSYKAAMAADSEGALAEYLQQSTGRSSTSSSSRGGAKVAQISGIVDAQQALGQAVISNSPAAQQDNVAEQRRARKPMQQRMWLDNESSDTAALRDQTDCDRAAAKAGYNASHNQWQQKHQHAELHNAALGSAAAGLPLRSVRHKRCVVRTSTLPVATAVHQKLQHVISFFPDMQLPGTTLLSKQQPGETSPPAAIHTAAAVDDGQIPAPSPAVIEPAALPTKTDTNMQVDDGSVELGHQHEQPTTDFSSEPPAPPSAVQQQSNVVPGVTNRPRRTRKPVTSRYSPPPSPSAAAAVRQQRSRSHTAHHHKQDLGPPRKKQHMIAAPMTANHAADPPTPAPSTPPTAATVVAVSGGSTNGTRNKGGRPRGSGNKHQMAPRSVDRSGRTGFALRSAKYTGVYQSRRAHEGWRAQFCFSNKVLNLGTYATEDDAARAWNAAALFFRGDQAWMNPVQPRLPEDFVPGSLGSSVPAATVTAAAAVAARAKQ